MIEYKTFTYDGENSADYGLYIAGDSVYDAPTRDMDMISIPGRNGQLAIDMGRYENITVTYPAFIVADTQAEFRQKVRRVRNWLCSKISYYRLTDEYNPESFRLGIYKSGLEVEPLFYNRAGRFELSFDCKPQRFLFTGEEVFTLGQWGETETISGSIASFEGTETTAVKSLKVNITPKQSGSGDPSPSNVRAISGWDSVETYDSPTAPNEDKNAIIECYREGSGTASLENIRPIHGVTIQRDNGNWYRFGEGYLDTSNRRVTMNSMRIVFTGDNYTLTDATNTTSGFRCRISTTIVPYENRQTGASNQMSSHAKYYTAGGVGNVVAESRFMAYGTNNYVYFYLNGYDTVETTNEYLTEQNSKGTPFTIWLVCAEPQTYDLSETEFQRLLDELDIQMVTTSLPSTVYGGTLDVVSGELAIDRAMIDLATNQSGWYMASTSISGKQRLAVTISDIMPSSSQYLLCNLFNTVTGSDTYIGTEGVGGDANPRATFYRESLQTIDAWKNFATTNGLKLVYRLANPTTVQLTPTQVNTLLGSNNIWADAGSVEVEIGEDPNILFNPTPFVACPTFEVEGSGTLSVGNTSLNISSTGTTIIDSETMEAYAEENGAVVSKNDSVSGEFPTLESGANPIGTSGLTSVKVTPKWYEL